MQNEFKGKNIVVTGAGNGTGRETVSRFVGCGANIFAIDYNAKRLSNLVAVFGSQVTKINADLGKPGKWITKLPDEIDVLCNVAGLIDPIDPDDDSPNPERPDIKKAIAWATGPKLHRLMDDLQRVFDTNYFGHHVLSLVAAGKMMKKRGNDSPATTPEQKTQRWGAIINVGSTNVLTLNERRLAYVPAKAALHTETLLLAKVLAPYGIRVNCVVTGAIANTDTVDDVEKSEKSVPLGINDPKDVVNAIEFLASDKASHVTGALLIVDGGRSL